MSLEPQMDPLQLILEKIPRKEKNIIFFFQFCNT